MEAFCKNLPKIELHAHINSSASEKTIGSLMKQKKIDLGNEDSSATLYKEKREAFKTLDECFNTFKLIHKVTNDLDSMYKVTCDVIQDFAEENVKYLELRSTPREVSETGMTRRSYIETVLKAIGDCRLQNLDIDVRLLLSIDRRNNVAVAEETVRLAKEFYHCTNGAILGIDLSGDPKVGNAVKFIPALMDAKRNNLKLALHIAEVANKEESLALLKVTPDRIGHGTFLHPAVGGSQEIVDLVLQEKIPIECCLTSNIKGQTVLSIHQHHFKYWYDQRHPVVLATDGRGVFCTSLSEEYCLAIQAFHLDKDSAWRLSMDSIDYIFAEDDVKWNLRRRWQDEKHKFQIDI